MRVPRPKPDFGLFIGAKEAGLQALTIEEIEDCFSTINIDVLVEVLAKLNLSLLDQGGERLVQNLVAQTFLSQETLEGLTSYAKKSQRRCYVITPLHIRMLLKVALRTSSTSGKQDLQDREVRERVGLALISIYEALNPTRSFECASPNDKFLADFLLVQHWAIFESTHRYDNISVKEEILSDLLSDGVLRRLFESKMGFTPEDLQAGLVILWAKFFHMSCAHILQGGKCTVDLRQDFGNAGIKAAVGDFILSEYAIDLVNAPIKTKETQRSDSLADFSFLAHRPLLKHKNGTLSCSDLQLLEGILVHGLWGWFQKNLDKPQRDSLLYSPSGYSFEKSINAKFAACAKNRPHLNSRYVFNVKYLTEEGEIDGLYQEDGNTILIESKQGYLASDIRFGSSLPRLREQLTQKLIGSSGDDMNRVGMLQLKLNTEEILRNWRSHNLARPRYIIPVLLVEDEILSCKSLASYIVLEGMKFFSSIPLTLRGKVIVMPPIVLSFHDMLRLMTKSDRLSPALIIKRLIRTGYRGRMFYSDVIDLEFPDRNWTERQPRRIYVRNFPISEERLDAVGRRIIGNVQRLCEVCGSIMLPHEVKPGAAMWHCTKFVDHPHIEVSRDEIHKIAEQQAACIDWYEASRM